MDQVLERIAAWETAGLIDPATAARLRLAEAELQPEPGAPAGTAMGVSAAAAGSPARRSPTSINSVFGPGVTLGEMFAYLGGAFLLSAFETFVVRLAGSQDRFEVPIAIGSMVAGVFLTVFGLNLMNGDARRRRAAGVLFALAVAHVGAAGAALAVVGGAGWPVVGVIGAGLATVAAIGLRTLHPAVLTQVALLTSATSLAGATLSWLEQLVVPERRFDDSTGLPILQGGAPDPIVLIAVSAAWWLVLAVIVGLLGLREAAAADRDPVAGRRASVTRLWAGLVAVIGLATAITRSDYSSSGDFGRVVEPWIGELAILVLAGVLVERAFRREASTYVYAAALGLMIALSDFNFSYLSSSAELGLLIEGLILLAAGFGADRLRRRLGRSTSPSGAPETAGEDDAPEEADAPEAPAPA